MFFRMVYDERLAQAAYLVGCQKTGEAIVFDPERDVDRYVELAEHNNLRIVAVSETHIHADFLSGARELAERTGAHLYLSGEGGQDWSYTWLDKRTRGGVYPHTLLKDGDVFHVGNIEFTALHTPGHTPEHLSYLVTDRGSGATEPMGVITGDFVFVGDLGRPDLLESAAGMKGVKEDFARTLQRSALSFLELPDHLQVWPAHGAGSACGKALGAVPQSTVGYEKRFNSALKLAPAPEAFVSSILEGQPEPPLYFARMKYENRDGPAVLGGLPEPVELDAAALAAVDGSETAVIDVRTWPQFCAGHLAGALSIPLNNLFPTVAGSYVDPDREVCLIAPAAMVDELVRLLVRVGIDRVVWFATPETLEDAINVGASAHATEDLDPIAAIADFEDGVMVLDVRSATEHAQGHVPGARHIAYPRLPAHLGELPRDKPIIVHCLTGVRSARATALLQARGYQAANLSGGISAWIASGGPVTTEGAAAPA